MVSNFKRLLLITIIIALMSQQYSFNKVVGIFKDQNSVLGKYISSADINKFGKRFLVKYKNSSNKQAESIGAKHLLNQWQVVEITDLREYESLRSDLNIESIVPDYPRMLSSPNDSYYNSQNSIISGQFDQWNLRSIGFLPLSDANSAWNISTGSDSTVIAVIDTGIALDNPDIANGNGTTWNVNNLWINQSEIAPDKKSLMDGNSDGNVDSLEIITYFINNNLDINGDGRVDFLDVISTGSPLMDNIDQDGNLLIDDLFGYNFADNNAKVNDSNGHGTHVSGIIAASTNNNSYVNPGIAGICWTCKIMTLKVINSYGYAFDSDIIKAINYAVDKGAKVINLSLGGPNYSQPLQDAITNAWEHGVLVVSAAGNYGASASDTYPGGNSYSLSVGAINYLDRVSLYSNTGGKLDVVAPGDYILSTYISFTSGCLGAGYYDCSSGTSMASAHVTGVAALIFDLHKNDTNPWTAKEVRYAILQNTSDLPNTQVKPNCTIIVGSFDECSGFGKINARDALLSTTMPADSSNPVAILNEIPEFIRGTIDITGTASDENIYSYTISFERVSDNYIVKQFTGRDNVNDSVLVAVDTTTLSDGEYIVRLRVEDFNGNTTTTSSGIVKIDNTKPSTFTLVVPHNGFATNNPRPAFGWTASNDANGVVYDIYYDGNLLANSVTGTNYTPSYDLAEGSKNWHVIARDPAGNTRSSETFTIIADRTPPNNFSISSTILDSSPTFTFATTDSISGIMGYQASLNGAPYAPVNSPYSPGPLPDGVYTITIRAYDNAGNIRESSATITINHRCNFLKSKADFNCDGTIDLSDLSILAQKWSHSGSVADANNDYITDLSDLSILAANWLKNF